MKHVSLTYHSTMLPEIIDKAFQLCSGEAPCELAVSLDSFLLSTS